AAARRARSARHGLAGGRRWSAPAGREGPLGLRRPVVTPPVRAMGMVNAEGSIASPRLNDGFMSPSLVLSPKPPRPATPVPALALAWIRPGVTHFPAASTTVAPGGTGRFAPTAAIRP